MELKENRLFCRKSGRDSIVLRGLWISEMAKFLYFIAFIITATHAQENALRNLPPSLRECYENKYLLQRDNRLPHTLNSLIAIIRKIENLEGLNMDLRSLSVALLHRFRQDGIVPNPSVPIQDGVTPYAPNAYQFFRHAQTLRFIPGNAVSFPNNSITDIERCTLHFMFSSSIEIFQRGDEAKVCRFASAPYRNQRSTADTDKSSPQSTVNDVETLSPHEIEIITKRKDADAPGTIDPNSLYPDLPPNHPDSARMFSLPPQTKCPVENGVIKTPWGPVSAGVLLAGITAGSQPETITLQDLQTEALLQKDKYPTGLTLDNKWIATLGGDLAEVALRQGPRAEKLSVGATGNWNSTALPRWYFLNSPEKLEFTTAEIRGGLDGLILANEVNTWYSKIPSLRLSQILDMYYSPRGFFDSAIKACNRRTLFTAFAPNSTMSPQAYSAALVLDPDLTKATLDFAAIEKFTVQAVKELTTYIPSQMNKDQSCLETDRLFDFNQISVDLTIILDTRWLFTEIQPVLAHLLDNIDINQYNSNFTLINGHDGTPIINSTNNILDFFYFNSSHYENVSRGFDLPKSLEKLNSILADKLNNERHGIGGARSDIVLLIPHTSSIDKTDKEYCLQNIRRMREQIPDTTMLILTYGSKDTWSDLVLNSATDLFSINIGDTQEALSSLTTVISRMKQVPKRLINTQCGSDYVSIGSSNQYVDYIEPRGINFYQLHPNYFYSSDGSNTATIKIQGSGSDGLTVCSSRELLHVNTTESMTSASCNSIMNDVHSITVSCSDSGLIHECPSLFLSVSANSTSTSYQCTDYRVCRFATLIKYTISYENLVCTSGSSRIMFTPIILVLIFTYLHV